jgi:DNA processing protein
MTELETAALVALLRHGRRPWPVYSELVEQAGSALAVLKRELDQVHAGQASLLPPAPDDLLEAASAALAGWTAGGLKLLTVLDPEYPVNLRAAHDRPPLIFVAGRLEPGDSRAVAVVGTRDATAQGSERARSIAEHLALNGYTVASGLAAGIDTAVHTATLAAKGRTLAVIGTGLAHSYPPQNAALQREIATRGAVVSQFWPEARPSRRSFPMRNAVMSGLTLGTVVVEASPTSGARVQARLALAHGRPVFLSESLMSQEWARALAARPGTHVIGSPTDITAAIERNDTNGALVG